MILLRNLLLPLLLLLSACDNNDSGLLGGPTLETNNVVELIVTPKVNRLPVGFELQLKAEVRLLDGRLLDVTNEPALNWSSSNASLAQVSNAEGKRGVVTGLDVGNLTITASGIADGQTFTDTAELIVTGATVTELIVSPVVADIPVGLQLQYRAEVTLSDGSVLDVTENDALTWSSSNNGYASVSNTAETRGLATGINPGTLTISASGEVNGVTFSNNASLTVTNSVITALTVTPKVTDIPVGLEAQYLAEVTFSDGSVLDVTEADALTWSSSNNELASVSNEIGTRGLVTGISPGTLIITASGQANGVPFTDSTSLTVTDATVVALAVTPKNADTPAGLEIQYYAEVTLSDGSILDVTEDEALSWASSQSDLATVSNTAGDKGLVTGISPGTLTISASGVANGKEFSDSANVTVTSAMMTELRVTPQLAETPVGLEVQFFAEATFSDGSVEDLTEEDELSWSSSNTAFATISNTVGSRGLATGQSPGTLTVTASGVFNGKSFSDSASLTVTNAAVEGLEVTPTTAEVPAGLEIQFQANVELSDGTVVDVTEESALSWSVSDNTLATISNTQGSRGLATGLNPGTLTVTASGKASGVTFTSSSDLTVTSAEITGLTIEPTTSEITVGLELQYQAIATFSDTSVLDVTNNEALNWKSDNIDIASISNTEGSQGLAVGNQVGNATITASGKANGITFTSNSAQLEVSNATIVNLSVFQDGKVPVGVTRALSAIATFSDGATLDVTKDVNTIWSSTDPSVADVSSEGVVSGLSQGVAEVSARYFEDGTSILGDATVTVEVDNSDFLLEAEESTFYGDKLGIQYTSIPAELAFPSLADLQGVKIDSFNQFWGYSNLSKAIDDLEVGDSIRIIANIDVVNSDASRSALLGINIVNRTTGDTIVIPTTCSTNSCEATYIWTATDDAKVFSSVIFKAGGGAGGVTIVYDTMQFIVN